MKRTVLFTLAAAALLAGAAKTMVRRDALAAMEKSMDRRIEQLTLDNPYMLLGNTRGIYLDGYGVVFTAEINLISSPMPHPFRPAFTKDDIAKIHAKKMERMPPLRQCMRDMLVSSAASLDQVPLTEQVVLGMSLFYFSWEDATGLPRQIVMQAERGKLVDFQARRLDESGLNRVLRVQEF